MIVISIFRTEDSVHARTPISLPLQRNTKTVGILITALASCHQICVPIKQPTVDQRAPFEDLMGTAGRHDVDHGKMTCVVGEQRGESDIWPNLSNCALRIILRAITWQ